MDTEKEEKAPGDEPMGAEILQTSISSGDWWRRVP